MNETASSTEYRLREIRADLERRMDSLERPQGFQSFVRWLGPALGGVALLVAGIVAVQTGDLNRFGTVAPALEAGAFVLKDEDGVERAAIGLRDAGEASFTLSDQSGRPRLRLSVLSDGSPGVSLLDTDGENRAILGLLADGTTTLVLADRGAVARGVFALTPDGAARMIFSDRSGVTRTAIGVDAGGRPQISTIEVANAEVSPGE
jgi:hypothetical protein